MMLGKILPILSALIVMGVIFLSLLAAALAGENIANGFEGIRSFVCSGRGEESCSAAAPMSAFFVFAIPTILTFSAVARWVRRMRRETDASKALLKIMDDDIGRDDIYLSNDYEESNLLGRDPAKKKELLTTYASALQRTVYEDVKALRFDPITTLLDRQRPYITKISNELASYQSLAVRLGILGTFVGLIFALNQVGDILPGADNVASGSLDDIVGSLAVAFGTSITGIVAAMIIVFLAGAMRGHELDLMRQFELLASHAQALCRVKLGDDRGIAKTAKELAVEMSAQKKDMIDTRNAIEGETVKLQEAAMSLAKQTVRPGSLIEDNAAALAQLLERLRDTLQETSKLAAQQTDVEERALVGFQKALDTVSVRQEERFETLVKSSTEAVVSQMSDVRIHAGKLSADIMDVMQDFAKSLRNAAAQAAQQKVDEAVLGRLEMIEKSVDTAVKVHGRTLRTQAALLFFVYLAGVGGIVALGFYTNKSFGLNPAANAVEGPVADGAPQSDNASTIEDENAFGTTGESEKASEDPQR